MNGYVYLIQDGEKENTYKIGVTKNVVDYRKQELQTGNSSDLIIVNYFATPYPYKVESMMHRKHKSKNIINEWFLLSDEDVKSFINDCKTYENCILALKDNPFYNL